MLESQQVQVQTLRHLVVSHLPSLLVYVLAAETYSSQHYAEVLFKAVSASLSSAIKHALSTKGVKDRN